MAGVNILFYFNPLNKRSSESLCTAGFSDDRFFWIELNPWALAAKYGRSKQEGCNFVIPAQAGIWKFEVAASLKSSQNAEAWIPACAGMKAAGDFRRPQPQK